MVDYGIFGPPGAGKGTQALAICGRLGLEHFSTGDAFRAAVRGGTELGNTVRGYLDRGQLVPDEVVLSVVMHDLGGRRSGVLFDGFPRTVVQARGLLGALAREGRALGAVVNLVVRPEIVVARIALRRSCQCGAVYHLETAPPRQSGWCDRCNEPLVQRRDDEPGVVSARLAVYAEQTAPVLDFLRGVVDVVDVDGERSVEEVTSSLFAALAGR